MGNRKSRNSNQNPGRKSPQVPKKAVKPRLNKAQLLHLVKILDTVAIGIFATFGAFQLVANPTNWTVVVLCAILFLILQAFCLLMLSNVGDTE